MDAGRSHSQDPWFIRLGEHAVRAVAVALVLTGQMLPAGAVSAQEEPASPTFSQPFVQADTERPAVPSVTEAAAPAPLSGEAKSDAALPPAASPEPTPAEVPARDTVAVPETAESEAAVEVAPAPETLLVTGPENEVMEATLDPNTFRFGDWTMTIRPGAVVPRSEPYIQAPLNESPAPMTNVSVPVTVTINNPAPHMPYGYSPWSTPWSYASYWNAPTSAYLFQRPQPYWQLRGDFYHLRPFIPGLMY